MTTRKLWFGYILHVSTGSVVVIKSERSRKLEGIIAFICCNMVDLVVEEEEDGINRSKEKHMAFHAG